MHKRVPEWRTHFLRLTIGDACSGTAGDIRELHHDEPSIAAGRRAGRRVLA